MKNVRDYKNVGKQFAYVLDSIMVENEVTGEEVTGLTDEQLIQWVFGHFNAEFGSKWERKQYPNEQERLAQWLRGLPSAIYIAFSDYDITEVGKSWGYCKTERQAAKFVENWWSLIACRLIQLREKLVK